MTQPVQPEYPLHTERLTLRPVTLNDVIAVDGAEELFHELRDARVKIVLTTGFSRATRSRWCVA